MCVLSTMRYGFNCSGRFALPSLILLFVAGLLLADAKEGCSAPPLPRHGSYSALPIECGLRADRAVSPGDRVDHACVLLYACERGYSLADQDVIAICDDGRWVPDDVQCGGETTSQDSSLINTVPDANTREGAVCVLPAATASDRWLYCPVHLCRECGGGGTCRSPAGSAFAHPAARIQCAAGHRLQDDRDFAVIPCVNGSWDGEFPQCLPQCPPLESDTVYLRCERGGREVACDRPALPGTSAAYRCRPSHTEYASVREAYARPLTCRHDGRWSSNLFECKPVCGVSKGQRRIVPTVVDGVESALGEFPWHAGLYRQDAIGWNCICGGSLVTSRVVLTAAHCVVLLSPEELRVALGKHYRAWDHNEHDAVKREVSKIRIPAEYNGGATTYVWDIALVLLSSAVPVNSFVLPVCRGGVDLAHDINRNKQGFVVGWGKTSANGTESEVLMHNDLTIIDYTNCRRKLPTVLGFDKFCGSKGSASVAEKGDSGGGVTTMLNDQHYVIGIVSVKIENLSVFTNVSWEGHRNWIDREIRDFDTYF